MTKEVFEGLGISNKDIREFDEALTTLAKDKVPTKNFEKISPVYNAIKKYADAMDDKVGLECTETTAIIKLSFELTGLFVDDSKELLREVLGIVDTLSVEFDEEDEERIMMLFIINDVFEL